MAHIEFRDPLPLLANSKTSSAAGTCAPRIQHKINVTEAAVCNLVTNPAQGWQRGPTESYKIIKTTPDFLDFYYEMHMRGGTSMGRWDPLGLIHI